MTQFLDKAGLEQTAKWVKDKISEVKNTVISDSNVSEAK